MMKSYHTNVCAVMSRSAHNSNYLMRWLMSGVKIRPPARPHNPVVTRHQSGAFHCTIALEGSAELLTGSLGVSRPPVGNLTAPARN